MKKYLLLASVAGCLLSAGNAIADDAGATLNVSADLDISREIYKKSDINFGAIVMLYSGQNPATGSAVLSTAGVVTATTGWKTLGTPSAGKVCLNAAGTDCNFTSAGLELAVLTPTTMVRRDGGGTSYELTSFTFNNDTGEIGATLMIDEFETQNAGHYTGTVTILAHLKE